HFDLVQEPRALLRRGRRRPERRAARHQHARNRQHHASHHRPHRLSSSRAMPRRFGFTRIAPPQALAPRRSASPSQSPLPPLGGVRRVPSQRERVQRSAKKNLSAPSPRPRIMRGMSDAPAPIRTAPLALWRIAASFLDLLYNLFGPPAHLAGQHTPARRGSPVLTP